jgi:hypothetical protein
MITIRYLGNAHSLHTRYEVLRDRTIVGCVWVPGTTKRNLSVGRMAMEIALRDFT